MVTISKESIDKAKARIEKEVPREFVLNDAIEDNLHEPISQVDILSLSIELCRILELDTALCDPRKHFFPNKKILDLNRVYNMDCRDLIPLCAPYKPKGVITDYPYGMDFQSNMRTKTEKFKKILNDDKPFLDQWIKQSYKVLQNPGFFVTFYRWDLQDELFAEIIDAGFEIRNQLVWDKVMGGMGDLSGSFGECHENAVFAVKGNYKFPEHAGRPWNMFKSIGGSSKSSEIVHPNEKQVPLVRKLIRDLTLPGDLIIEPFSGSGTTGEACVLEGRNCIASELDNRIVKKINCTYTEWGNRRMKEAATKISLF